MKDFFYIVFGGLAIILIGIGIVPVAKTSFNAASQIHITIPRISLPKFSLGNTFGSNLANSATKNINQVNASSLINNPVDRYSAFDEEDMINSAISSLPSGVIKGVTANAYSVKNLTTGQVIVEKNATQLLPIASLTKLVTAVVARKLISDTARINITNQVMATYGNTADFKAGETFSAKDLLYPLLMVSSNDAGEAYAEYYGRTKFIKAMNDFTESIGAYRTYFADPSGLDPKNVSTANDLATILDWIRKNDPGIIAITELKVMTVRNHTWVNPTHFLSWSYFIGGKNGYLPEANRTTASLFQLGASKEVYSIILLGSSNRDNDMISLLKKIK